jgi:predicted transcriptional regulator
MSLIPAQHVEPRDTVPIRMDHAVHERLELYAAFIQSPKHYVVAQALERLYRSDKMFTRWLAERARPRAGS